jgi:hypothetical protein
MRTEPGGCRDTINVGVELEDSLNDTSDSCIVIDLDAELTPGRSLSIFVESKCMYGLFNDTASSSN